MRKRIELESPEQRRERIKRLFGSAADAFANYAISGYSPRCMGAGESYETQRS
jgi:hypothetical protein